MLINRLNLVGGLLAASLYGAYGAVTPAQAQELLLGASVQVTGPVANTGRYYRDAYEFAIDKINAAGGVKVAGVAHRLALKLYDNQSDVSLSVRQYTQRPVAAASLLRHRARPGCNFLPGPKAGLNY